MALAVVLLAVASWTSARALSSPVQGGPPPGAFLGLSIGVDPPVPSEADSVTVTFSGHLSGCFKMGSISLYEIVVMDGLVFVAATGVYGDVPCPAIEVPFSLTKTIGPLEAGPYTLEGVFLAVDEPCGFGECGFLFHSSISSSFTVVAGTTPPATTTSRATVTPTATITPTPTRTATPVPATPTPWCIRGDVDRSGSVNAVDTLLILRHVAGLALLPCKEGADQDSDGDIDAVDAMWTLWRIAGLIAPP